MVNITETGNLNEGSFRYSIDGGNNFSDEYTIPLGGAFEMQYTGLTLEFTNTDASDGTKSFISGDAYSFSTTVPTVNNAHVLEAVEKLAAYNRMVEVCHIVGVSGKALWAALQGEAEEFLTMYKKPVIFLCEARACKSDETLDEYMAAMEAEKKGISSYFICVSLTYGTYMRKDLRIQNINMAGVISGLIGQAKESLSIGCVEEFPVSSAKLLKILPEGIENYNREFDNMKYTIFRQYDGKEDFYVSNGNVMASAGSDFQYVGSVRVQTEIDPGGIESSIKAIEAYFNIAMEYCERDKIISSGEVTINTEGLNILRDETLDVEAVWVPMGTARVYNIKFAVSNPASSGGE